MAEPQSGNEPINGHPESVDPPWFQELVRRAFEREMRRYQSLAPTPTKASNGRCGTSSTSATT